MEKPIVCTLPEGALAHRRIQIQAMFADRTALELPAEQVEALQGLYR